MSALTALTILTINGIEQKLAIDPGTPLLYALRNQLQLNGAKFGCGLGQCGACTVLLDDQPVFACVTPIAACAGRQVRTIESLGSAAHPGPLQAAFIKHQAAQCGYCIAGMVMRAQGLLEQVSQPTEAQIRAHMEPNLCRCGTHMRILAAIREVSMARSITGPANSQVRA